MTTSDAFYQKIALQLEQAEQTRVPIEPLSKIYSHLTPAISYAIQSQWLSYKLEQGRRIIGRKIGLTSQAMQEQMGVDQPDYGFLLDSMMVPSGSTIAGDELIQARIEPEIAFWLARDLRGPGVTLDEVLEATHGVSAALEVVDSRIKNWRITLVDTIADNASSGRMVVSETLVPVKQLDLAAVTTVLTRNNEPVGRGMGAAVLGHPALAVAWLANKLAEFGIALLSGQVILSGAMCAAVPIAPGNNFRAIFSDLGEVLLNIK